MFELRWDHQNYNEIVILLKLQSIIFTKISVIIHRHFVELIVKLNMHLIVYVLTIVWYGDLVDLVHVSCQYFFLEIWTQHLKIYNTQIHCIPTTCTSPQLFCRFLVEYMYVECSLSLSLAHTWWINLHRSNITLICIILFL